MGLALSLGVCMCLGKTPTSLNWNSLICERKMKYDVPISHDDQEREKSERYFKMVNHYIKLIIMSPTIWKTKPNKQ